MCLLSISFLLSFCRELPCKTNGVFSLLVKITCRGTLGLTQASILDHDGDGEQWAPFTSGLAGAVLFVCFSIHKGLYKKKLPGRIEMPILPLESLSEYPVKHK